ncbi:hypothetical protein MSG28_011432 [Choristoneura fumiferana]|uniref:Uncharacterized protein n=1 Tax=Choristoneura fumiferana TaxID=7141 RepID=A0ACC0JNE3_CHOFU|nr:hypothetical protein MSG28_011432 [Choristoneura fumiferana]
MSMRLLAFPIGRFESRQEPYIYVPLQGTGLLSELEGLGSNSHAVGLRTSQTPLNCFAGFTKLSLKKNKPRKDEEIKKLNCSSDIIILDDSFEKLKLEFPHIKSTPKVYSPIIINDSTEFEDSPSLIQTRKQPSTNGNLDFDDDDSDKENVRVRLKENKKLYLTGSERKLLKQTEGEKSSKKKLFTEKIISTPQPPKQTVKRNVNSTTKKKLPKGKSVTELVKHLEDDVDSLVKQVKNVTVTPDNCKRLSFMGSLADNVPRWRCHPEAFQYRDGYKQLRSQLTRRLYEEFNRVVFDGALDDDLPITWDTSSGVPLGPMRMWHFTYTIELLRKINSTTTNRLVKTSRGDRLRTSAIKIILQSADTPMRVRDTLIHELCHAATWLLDAEPPCRPRPLWKKCNLGTQYSNAFGRRKVARKDSKEGAYVETVS